MAELGDMAVVILDMHEFVNRVAQALYAQFGYNCILLADKVEYFDPAKPQLLKCMFSKDRRFEWQQEFRILFCEATDRGPIEGMSIKSARRPPSVDLEIGGIGDIVQTMPIKDLVEGRLPSSTQFIPAMFGSGTLTGFELLVNETRLEIASLITREVPSFVIDAISAEMRSYTDVFGEDSAFVEVWQFAMPTLRLTRGFAKEEWAEAFLDGDIYMNTLGYFWNNGSEEQADCAEGVCAAVRHDLVRGFPEGFYDVQATYTRFLPAGMQYCNICCFTMQVSSLANRGLGAMVEGPLETLDLGEHLIVIDDARAFVDRVIAAAEESGYECVMGPVEYRQLAEMPRDYEIKHTVTLRSETPMDFGFFFPDGDKPELTADAFVKTERYRNQLEWRIALNRGERSDQPLVLHVGDLRDICHTIHRSELEAGIEDSLFKGESWLPCEFYGNTTREQLRNDLFELGDGLVYLLATIG